MEYRTFFWVLFTVGAAIGCLITAAWQVTHPDRSMGLLCLVATGTTLYAALNAALISRLVRWLTITLSITLRESNGRGRPESVSGRRAAP